jgi:uncharacterized Zn finger protein (UPF0148 family)
VKGGGAVKYCGKCGAPLREGKGFCPKCGAEVRRPEPAQTPVAVKERRPRRGAKRLVTALIVLVLLGGIGAAGCRM